MGKRSAVADQYELDVANYISSVEGVEAERPRASTKYSDVRVRTNGETSWVEVKMHSDDNLGNPRAWYDGERWTCVSESPLAKFCVDRLNESEEAATFVDDMRALTGRPDVTVPTTRGGIRDERAVKRDAMAEFFSTRDKYICRLEDVDVGELITSHYLHGKEEPAHYMSIGDGFYLLGEKNPLGLPGDVPPLVGRGIFKVRVSIRSRFYEVQPDVKIRAIPLTPYSVKPGTAKLHPFSYK